MSQDPHDLLAAYALDALDDDERERFERHLAECDDCSEQLALLREPVAALAYAAEGPAPPEALRGRIIEGARGEPRSAVIQLPRRNWALGAVAAVAVAAASLAIGLGLWAHSLSDSLDRERSANAAYEQAAKVLAAKASAKPLIGANGSLLVAKDGRAALVVCGLTGAPSAKTYEAWVIAGKSPQPAGLFRGGSGCNPVLLTQRVPKRATVAVTLEPAGGATSPTLPILFRAEAT
ncbi:MAG TPA: anti-sigma factor [Gaiellaceae bacterium]|jgi:anti-sigma-K factor RskA